MCGYTDFIFSYSIIYKMSIFMWTLRASFNYRHYHYSQICHIMMIEKKLSKPQYIDIGNNERLARNWTVYSRVRWICLTEHCSLASRINLAAIKSISSVTTACAEIKPYILLSAYSYCLISERKIDSNDITSRARYCRRLIRT